MDIATVVNLIQTIGFPAMVCVGCFWYIREQQSEMTKAISANTLALQKLIDKLGEYDGK